MAIARESMNEAPFHMDSTSSIHTSLLKISEAMGSSLELRTVLNTILELTLKEMNAQQGSILLFDKHQDRLQMLASIGLPEEMVRKGYIPRKGSIAEYVIENGLPIGTTGEALTRRLLVRMAENAHEARWREHVTLYAKENPSDTGGIFLQPRPACECPDLSLTVDEMPDYLRVQEVARKLDRIDFDLPALIRQTQSLNSTPTT